MSFQTSRKLQADGIIGVKTWTALFNGSKAAPKPTPKPKPKPKRKGTYGNGRCPAGKGAVNNGLVPSPNGCGAAGGLPVPDLDFNACCNAHDRCYSDCSKSRGQCDSAFLTCMDKRCEDIYEDWWEVVARGACKATAKGYHAVVESKGKGAFDNATKKHCTCV